MKIVSVFVRVKPLAVLQGHTAPVTSCTFGPGATKLATASRDMVSLKLTLLRVVFTLYLWWGGRERDIVCVLGLCECEQDIIVLASNNADTTQAPLLMPHSVLQSVKIWDLMVCQMDSSPAPECTLTRCHADWINACSWSNVSDFMVSLYIDWAYMLFLM